MKNLGKIVLAFLTLCICLTGCGNNEKNAAEAYLADHSKQELLERFQYAAYMGLNWDNPREFSTEELFYFAVIYGNIASEEHFNEEDRLYHIPLAEIYEILGGYFIDFVFVPEECPYTDYDAEKQELTAEVTGFGSPAPDYQFVSAEAVTEDRVEVRLLGHIDKIYEVEYWDSYVVAEIIDGEAKICSCYSEDRN